ncbi:MAG: nickel pincer cofactor biosynthesis protein LarC [Actinomycetota bacterium]|nr:nickel pincer cofactor biosynthesis protein LarC [Actinomycetota bacterium]
MTILYFDCFSGAAGDMLLGALIDAGVPEDTVRGSLQTLGLPEWELQVDRVVKHGIAATRVKVATQDLTSRNYREIKTLLEDAPLEEGVRSRALRTFEVLAQAEAKVHGSDPQEVHFHEVGGVDALIDIVGCAAAIEHLAPSTVVASALVTGRGWVTAAHGLLPVPAPAVLEILRGVELEEHGDQELVTPTGAAILAAASDSFGAMPPLKLESIGYGAGERDLDRPNVVRVVVGTESSASPADEAWLIETNIDDMSGELIPYCIDSLLRAGASDAWSTPILMKKGRPAVTLSILVAPEQKERVLDVLYRETTTLGARSQRVAKDELQREWVEIEVQGEPLRVKLGRRGGELVTASPEYEDAVRVAQKTGLPLRRVFELATTQARSTSPE